MERILHCLIGSMNIGGIEQMLMETYRKIDKRLYQFDFLVHDEQENYFEQEIILLGGKIYRCPYVSRKPLRHIRLFYSLLEAHPEYRVIHIHATYSIMITDAICAKKLGRTVIIHSHNNWARGWKRVFHRAFKSFFDRMADYRVACSELAAEWMFYPKQEEVFFWYNAFDVQKYLYCEIERATIRQKYQLEDKLVIGNVGRFCYQKNQERLIEIFKNIHDKNENTVLLLVGDGRNKKKLVNQCRQQKLTDCVIFAGMHEKTRDYYSAMDVYLCSSRYEGLGITLIEAQLGGLNVVGPKEKISQKIMELPYYQEVSVHETTERWAENVLLASEHRNNDVSCIIESNYNIDLWIKKVEEFYAQVYA